MPNLLPILSLISLAAAIFIGCWRRVNIGLLSIGFAFLIGCFGADLPPTRIVSGWPLRLFFMLLGMTLLFGIAAGNGTLSLLAGRCVAITRGRTRLLPPVFFLLAGVLAAVGPGNIAICALLLPIALTVASERKISPLLMATMVIAGANAGGLSPIAPTGIIGVTLARESGLEIGWMVFTRQIIGQSIMAATLYMVFGGFRLPNQPRVASEDRPPFRFPQWATLVILAGVVFAVIAGRWDLGLTAFSGAVILLLLRAAEEKSAMNAVPWSTLVLVCGVGMLVSTVQEVGGIDLLTRLLARGMTGSTAAPIMALIGGTLSVVSSASGVVMPTLIPTAAGLAVEVGANPARIISAIIIGAHVVTNSPISTLGALAIASAGPAVDRDRLFRNLLALALAGLVYAALLVYVGIV
ncbi:MAG: SLC13 family permease [Kiritimatiellia bacterium]|nr:SLC13 family permease [Kiritimatiellia bacterium]